MQSNKMIKFFTAICFFFLSQIYGTSLPISDHPFGLSSIDSRLDELCKDLEMPPIEKFGLVPTINRGGGFMRIQLDPTGERLVDFARKNSCPILDIGAAYGVGTNLLLKDSSCVVIANDIGAENLLVLRKKTEDKDRVRLYLNNKRFPQELELPKNSLGGVLASRIFHFLRGEEIEMGLAKIFNWLVPGGKLAIVTATPYLSNLKEFVPLYEERWINGNYWPGYVEDFSSTSKSLAHNLNPFLHVMDEKPLRRALEAVGFMVEEVEYIDRSGSIPILTLDGREGIGIIAVKP